MTGPEPGPGAAPTSAPGATTTAVPRRDPLQRAAVIAAAFAFLLVLPAGMTGLVEPTETRTAEIAREMRASGDWLTPRLDGLAHLDEPPLAHWASALGIGALGANAWGARVPVALVELSALLLALVAARRRFAPLVSSPALVAWLMGSTLLLQVLGRAVGSDPYLLAAVTGWWALAPSPWALPLLGLGFLAKGPVVLVPTLLPVLVAAAWRRERAPLALLRPAWGWLVFAAIAVPWFAVMAARTPALTGFWLGGGLWTRTTTTQHERGGPLWYFVAVLIAGAVPWTPAVLAGLGRAWHERARPEARLLLAWVLAPLVVFSLSGSRLPADYLPCLPGVALLAAMGLEGKARWARQATSLLMVLMAAAGFVAARHLLGRVVGVEPPEAFRPPLAVWLALVAFLLAGLRALEGPSPRAALLAAVAWTALLLGLAPYDRALGSPRAVAQVLAETRRPDEPVIEVGRLDAGLPFYLGEPVRLLDVPREPTFDDRATRARVFVTRDSLVPLTQAHQRVWLAGPPGAVEALADSAGLRWTRLATWKGGVVGFVAR